MKDLLLLLCQYPYSENNKESLSRFLTDVKDWTAFVKLINSHGIIALAAYNIKESGLEKEIPAEAMAILENGYMQSMLRNTWLTERWKEVNTILCNAGIKHILLKGMALEHTLYGAKGLRQMNDNDIFVKPEESIKAWNLLQKEEFAPDPFKSPLFKKIKFDFGRHLPALYKNGYALEIHDKLSDVEAKDESVNISPFDDAIEILIGEHKALILQREKHLRYLTSHLKHHVMAGDFQLRLYTDIKLLDSNNPLEIPDRFISDPMQSNRPEFRKAAYQTRICSIPPKHRLRFIIGDTFPSVKWMKKRYKCNGFKALFWYPLRIGKLRWLI